MSVSEKLVQMKNEKAAANLEAGLQFLTKNKEREEVIETESGLQYEVLTMGSGAKPRASNDVTCHYHGTVIDGDRKSVV